MPTVYVINGLWGTGGAFMAYNVGRLIHRHFHYKLVSAHTAISKFRMFDYDVVPKVVPLQALQHCTEEDILVCNPLFSNRLFGLKLPCRKLMYVQDITTFKYLDCQFDLYVSASTLIRDYLQHIYDIKTKVAPPFIRLGRLPTVPSWQERPPYSIFCHLKEKNDYFSFLQHYVIEQVKRKLGSKAKLTVQTGRTLKHQEFFKQLGHHRFYLNLTPVEGFGLVNLEAMALRTVVMGFDGLAGKDYFRYGENSFAVSLKEPDMIEKIAVALELCDIPEKVEAILAAGEKTAAFYSFDQFKRSWLPILEQWLGKPASS